MGHGSLEPDLIIVYKVWETILSISAKLQILLEANRVGKCPLNFQCFLLIGPILRGFSIVFKQIEWS